MGMEKRLGFRCFQNTARRTGPRWEQRLLFTGTREKVENVATDTCLRENGLKQLQEVLQTVSTSSERRRNDGRKDDSLKRRKWMNYFLRKQERDQIMELIPEQLQESALVQESGTQSQTSQHGCVFTSSQVQLLRSRLGEAKGWISEAGVFQDEYSEARKGKES